MDYQTIMNDSLAGCFRGGDECYWKRHNHRWRESKRPVWFSKRFRNWYFAGRGVAVTMARAALAAFHSPLLHVNKELGPCYCSLPLAQQGFRIA